VESASTTTHHHHLPSPPKTPTSIRYTSSSPPPLPTTTTPTPPPPPPPGPPYPFSHRICSLVISHLFISDRYLGLIPFFSKSLIIWSLMVDSLTRSKAYSCLSFFPSSYFNRRSERRLSSASLICWARYLRCSW